MQEYVIEFDCWEHANLVEVQLEPEAMVFTCSSKDRLKFVAKCERSFTWAVKFSGNGNGIQLYPESNSHFDIQVYCNDNLVY